MKEANKNIKTIVIQLNKDGHIIFINNIDYKIFNQKAENNVIGKNWFNLVNSSTYNQSFSAFEKAMNGRIDISILNNTITTTAGKCINWNHDLIKENNKTIGAVILGIDISETIKLSNELINTKKQLKKEKELLQAIIDINKEPVVIIDNDYKAIKTNKTAKKNPLFPVLNEQCYNSKTSPNNNKCHTKKDKCPLFLSKQNSNPFSIDYDCAGGIISNVNKKKYTQINVTPLISKKGESIGIIKTMSDDTAFLIYEEEIDRKNYDIHKLTYIDQLTNLPNHFSFTKKIREIINNTKEKLTPFTILHIDINKFQSLNNSFGRHVGDEILLEVSERISSTTHNNNVFARISGDEFLFLEPNCNGENAILAAQDILSNFNTDFRINKEDYHLTATIGISIYPDDGDSAELLMKHANTALHKAKETGVNNFEFYQKDMTNSSLAYVTLESRLIKGLKREEFLLHYQPKVDIHTGKISGLEALIRWNSQRGMIPPDQFIPIAEENGLIIDIGQWVFRTACKQAVEWTEKNIDFGRIAVNLSGRQFCDPNLLSTLKTIIHETKCSTDLIEVEVTESHLMNNIEHTISILNDIKKLGIKLSIDDFGTGYSSMSQLKKLPIDTLKIDRSFVKELPDDANDKAIAEAIIALGQAMSLNIIAEGVETIEQSDYLKNAGCHQIQGYYYYKPMPTNEITEILILEEIRNKANS